MRLSQQIAGETADNPTPYYVCKPVFVLCNAGKGCADSDNEKSIGEAAWIVDDPGNRKGKGLKNTFVLVYLEIYGGLNFGRICMDDNLPEQECYNSNLLHTSYGGSFWITGSNNITLSIKRLYYIDAPRFSFGFGLDNF